MIIHHGSNIAGFKGSHVYHWPGQIAARISKIVSIVADINFRVKVGTVEMVASGSVPTLAAGVNVPFEVVCEFIIRSIGGSGTIMATGRYNNGLNFGLLASTAVKVVDTTIVNDIAASAQWAVADPSNIVKAQNITIERSG